MNPTYPPAPLPTGSLDALPAAGAPVAGGAAMNPMVMQMLMAMMSGKGGAAFPQRKQRKPVNDPSRPVSY